MHFDDDDDDDDDEHKKKYDTKLILIQTIAMSSTLKWELLFIIINGAHAGHKCVCSRKELQPKKEFKRRHKMLFPRSLEMTKYHYR